MHGIKAAVLGSLIGCGVASLTGGRAADYPQYGQAWSRNMVSAERGLPTVIDPRSSTNLIWKVTIGTETHGTPIIAKGRVYIGTNNGEPHDPRRPGDLGVLLCVDERDGHLIWQLAAPKRELDQYYDWPRTGLCSPPTVEGKVAYVVDNRGEVLALDTAGMANGNDGSFKEEGRRATPLDKPVIEAGPLDADILWQFNLTTEAGIWSHDGAHSSILVDGRFLYLNSGTGVDNTHKVIRTPDAPSLVVLDKKTGHYMAREREGIAPNIFHCTWSSPSLVEVGGRKLILFGAGDGVLYAFKPLSQGLAEGPLKTLEKVWSVAMDPDAPKEQVHRFNGNKKESPVNIYGMPVVVGGLIYVASGGDLFWGKNEATVQAIDGNGKLVWKTPVKNHVIGTPAVKDGLLYIADCGRGMHCLDAATGAVVWEDEIKGEAWASPMVADGKVYLGTRSGDFYVWSTGREKKLLHSLKFPAPISGTVSVANGRLYVASMTTLYSFGLK